jgi:ankyrin repeat protein/uncharacterized protein YegL
VIVMARGGMRGNLHSSSISHRTPEEEAALLKKIKSEARRNFLRQYTEEIANYFQRHTINNAPVLKDLPAEVDQQITAYEGYLTEATRVRSVIPADEKNSPTEALPLVLLSNVGDDTQGISRNLAAQFGQLELQARLPFVELEERGLCFYWDTQAAAEQFTRRLQAGGVRASSTNGKAPTNKEFVNATYSTIIPHLSVDQLLIIAQYHPYNIEYVVDDLYKSRGLNRASLLINDIDAEENLALTQAVTQVTSISQTAHASYPHDIVKIKLAPLSSRLPETKNDAPEHIVFLLDDSFSMVGAKMKHANAALRKCVDSLPDHTLISIQPFNASTVAYRLSVGEIKKFIGAHPSQPTARKDMLFSIPATGGTPLVEMLVNSAAFVRNNPNGLMLTAQELNRTTIVMLTDGQANGPAKDAIHAMKTTQGHTLQGNLQLCNLEPVNPRGLGQIDINQMPLSADMKMNTIYLYVTASGKDGSPIINAVRKTSAGLIIHTQHIKDIQQDPNLLDVGVYKLDAGVHMELVDILKDAGRISVERYLRLHQLKASLILGIPIAEGEAERLTSKNFISYGVGGFSCQQLPVVFSVAIGAEATQQFIEDLAHGLHCPHVFVNDASLEQDMDHLVSVLTNMRGRQPSVVLGLAYVDEKGEKHAKASKLYNLFYNHEREVFFEIPKGAKNLVVYLMENGEAFKISGNQLRQVTQQEAAAFQDFVKAKFQDLVLAYQAEWNSHAPNASVRGLNVEEPAVTNNNVTQLVAKTRQQVTELIALCTDSQSIADMQLFADTIGTQHQSNVPVHNNRAMVANFTQQRQIGLPIALQKLQRIQQRLDEDIQIVERHQFNLLVIGDFEALEQLDIKKIINETQTANSYQATLLIFGIVLLEKYKNDPSQQSYLTKLRQFIHTVLLNEENGTAINLLSQDGSGNTALHRAAFYGEYDILTKLLQIAQQTHVLDALKLLRNQNQVGATQGETFVDHILLDYKQENGKVSNKFSNEKKDKLLRLTACMAENESLFDAISKGNRAVIKECIQKDPKQLSQHSKSNIRLGATPLLALLFELSPSGKLTDAAKAALRNFTLELIDQQAKTIDFSKGNFNGNTPLHYALFNGEFDIAIAMLKAAEAQQSVAHLLTARNNRNEVPSLNLVSVGNGLTDSFKQRMTELQTEFLQACASPNASITAADITTFAEKIESDPRLIQIKHQMLAWKVVLDIIKTHSTHLQQAEIQHLFQVAQKHEQGYSAYHFLRAAPVIELLKLTNRLITYMNTQRGSENSAKFNGAKTIHDMLRNIFLSEDTVQNVLEYVNTELDNKNNPLFKATFSSALKKLFIDVKDVLSQVLNLSSQPAVQSRPTPTK